MLIPIKDVRKIILNVPKSTQKKFGRGKILEKEYPNDTTIKGILGEYLSIFPPVGGGYQKY